MEELEKWAERIGERIQRVNVTEQTQSLEFSEIMEFQRSSIGHQHESLGGIAYRLSHRGQINAEPVRWLLGRTKTTERYDAYLVHKLPALVCCLSLLASSDNMCRPDEAKAIHETITSFKDGAIWSLPNLQAAISVTWLAEYSSRHSDRPATGPARASGAHTEAEAYDANFNDALHHGALQFLLAVSHDARKSEWFDPARQGFHTFLIQDAPTLHVDAFPVQDFFKDAVLEVIQYFVEGIISNMPDALRKLKFEEDEQRRQMQGRHQLRPSEFELHLERFLLIMSNAFDGYIEAAEKFWTGGESNLYGFLQWASMRQSTPRVAAFCELLQALSSDGSTADSAHIFLAEETPATTVRSRRNCPLSWGHIFRELEYYSSTIRDRPTPQATSGFGPRLHPDLTVEPESSMMLECYLRLIAHLSSRSQDARVYLLRAPMDMVEHLMHLFGSNIPSRLRACAFTALSGLLTDKDIDLRNTVWNKIDGWIYAQPVGAGPQAPRPVQQPSTFFTNAEKLNFERISPGFEEPNAFVNLMKAMVAPVEKELPIKDSLPFPEDLGARYRMSGIEPYIDFIMGQVFATKSHELTEPLQLRIMRWSCLSFATSCLNDFNEDLIVLANRSRISVESAIETSSLAAYARLHPFARVMEWFFNDQVITGLFAAVSQEIADVNSAAFDSPFVLSLLAGLQCIDVVLTLQRTYFDLIRPLIKTQANGRRPVVANSALATFEDAVITRLDLVNSLGLYCGSGHSELAVSALRLLKRLSESRKLATPISARSGRAAEKSRLIVALERGNEADGVSRALANIMQFDPGEISSHVESPGLIIKAHILDFLATSLDAIIDRPSIAHLLLGFACGSHSVFVNANSLFGTEQSLFDSVVAFGSIMPDRDDLNYLSLLLSLRNKAIQVLQRLWRSPLSSELVLSELRNPVYEFFFTQALRQETINSQTLWDGLSIRDHEFWVNDSANGYAGFLQMRTAFYELATIELRAAQENGLETHKLRILSSLFGTTKLSSGDSFTNATLYDLLDFIDLPDSPSFAFPSSQFFEERMFDTCKTENVGGSVFYNVDGAQQITLLRQNETLKLSPAPTENDRQALSEEALRIETWVTASNARENVVTARQEALRSWVNLATVVLSTRRSSGDNRQALVLQLLQLILPKLERAYHEDVATAEVFATCALTLMRNVDLAPDELQGRNAVEEASDKAFDLFRVCLAGIQCPDSSSTLRQTCARSARIFIIKACAHQYSLVRRIVNATKSFGDRLLDITCDDADGGDDQSRVSALLLLEALVYASNLSQSKHILEAFSHRNFVQITVGLLGRLSNELQQASLEGTRHRPPTITTRANPIAALPDTYGCINANLALLARVAQNRQGGALVLSAGLFPAIRQSGIFSADPDIGLDFDDSAALKKFYELMLAILHVVNAVVVSQSVENEQTVHQARQFLHEYRPSVTSIFKRHAGIGSRGGENKDVLNDLVDNYTALVIATEFIEVNSHFLQIASTF